MVKRIICGVGQLGVQFTGHHIGFPSREQIVDIDFKTGFGILHGMNSLRTHLPAG